MKTSQIKSKKKKKASICVQKKISTYLLKKEKNSTPLSKPKTTFYFPYTKLTDKEKEIKNESFKSPISKKKNLPSRSSILSINSSGDKSSYRNSATREKFLRNSRKRKRKLSKSPQGISQDSKYLVNKSSILIGNSSIKSSNSRLRKKVKKSVINEEKSEVISVLGGSEIKSRSISHFAVEDRSSKVLRSQDINYNFHSSVNGKGGGSVNTSRLD